ncbi:MAG: YkgJ family cysteine cluster protein [Spirochaetales bacterium]|nr:YkgJ family cysteine cluster protein [Spirochaetales bacterium]
MNHLKPEKSFSFECTLCGECCSGNTEINLNPYDLYKMARFLQASNTQYLFDKYYVILVRGQNNMLVPRIKFKTGKYAGCPFLENVVEDSRDIKGYCKLHPDAKPLVCKMAPLGRIIDFESHTEQYTLTPPVKGCPGMKNHKTNTIQEFIAGLEKELEEDKRFFRILEDLNKNHENTDTSLKNMYFFETIGDFHFPYTAYNFYL